MNFRTTGACALILAAVIAANLISSHYGPSASIYNAFFLIGLTLTFKDFLYDAWGRNRVRNTAFLILAGSTLSYFAAHWFAGSIPPAVVRNIAVASFVAYMVSEAFDTLVYAAMQSQPWLERSNASNLAGALLDSSIFVSLAFGWSWPIVFGQFCAKVAGGFLWSLVLAHTVERRDVRVVA